KSVSLTAVALALAALSTRGNAATVSVCAGSDGTNPCSFSLSVDGTQLGSGTYNFDSNGNVVFSGPITGTAANGAYATVGGLNGSSDPILGFSVSAGTPNNSAGGTFSFTFSLPISLSGQLAANSSVSYSLTALSSAGAEVQPLLGAHVVTAQEVDSA